MVASRELLMPRPKRKCSCHPDVDNYGHGLCKPCYDKAYRENNPDKILALKRKDHRRKHLMSYHKMTEKTYDVMYEEQSGKCYICEQSMVYHLHVDHEHATGKIRALLCRECNWMVGLYETYPSKWRDVPSYVKRFKDETCTRERIQTKHSGCGQEEEG